MRTVLESSPTGVRVMQSDTGRLYLFSMCCEQNLHLMETNGFDFMCKDCKKPLIIQPEFSDEVELNLTSFSPIRLRTDAGADLCRDWLAKWTGYPLERIKLELSYI